MNRVFLTILFLTAASMLKAQEIKAVLVQLSAEQNRINYFHKHNQKKDEATVILEAKKIRHLTMMDFTDNFVYCPVYYFIDTDATFIKNKHFDGKLLDAQEHVVSAPVIGPSDSDYVVVYYGYPDQEKSVVIDHKGLVVLNDKFIQIYYLFKGAKDPLLENKDNEDYTYISPKYDMGYLPFAAKLNLKIGKAQDKLEQSRY